MFLDIMGLPQRNKLGLRVTPGEIPWVDIGWYVALIPRTQPDILVSIYWTAPQLLVLLHVPAPQR